MNFECFFQTKDSFLLQVWANKRSYRWESGGAFGSDWSTNRWYEGLIIITKENAKWHFFFKTYKVRDDVLPEFNHQTLFGDMTNMEVLSKCEQVAFASDKSPFPFVEIGRNFSHAFSKKPDTETHTASL